MKMTRLLLLAALLAVVCSCLLIACGDDDDDDNDDDQGDCIVCDSTAECTAALGEGWGCQGGCCEKFGDDDIDGDDDDDDDDDTGDDDDDDDDDVTPGDVDFVVETVDRTSGGNRQTSIKATADGAVHVAYTGCNNLACDNNVLAYSVKPAGKGAFATTYVDTQDGDTGWFPSMEIDDAGTVYVLYGNHQRHKLNFAWLEPAGAWQKKTIDNGNGGFWTSCALAGDRLVLAHTELEMPELIGSLEAGQYFEGSWAFEPVDTSYDSGWFTAMATTPDNRPVISYMAGGYPVGFLTLAEWTGTEWTLSSLDGNAIGSDVAVDSFGYLHLVYAKVDPQDANLWDLWYATNSPNGDWSKVALDAGENDSDDTGHQPHLVIDDDDNLHVSYRNGYYNELCYARKVGDEWTIYTADGIGHGTYSSIALDGLGGVHIAYEDGQNI
ncbi:MAG TPA: hypothetical protein PK961_17340, partial [bacterium]|nr:hypothetical protein [bacterium]